MPNIPNQNDVLPNLNQIEEQTEHVGYGSNGNEMDLAAFYCPYIPLQHAPNPFVADIVAVEDISINGKWQFVLHKDADGNFLPRAKDAFDWIITNLPITSRKFTYADRILSSIPFSTRYGIFDQPVVPKNTIIVELFNKQSAALLKILFQD